MVYHSKTPQNTGMRNISLAQVRQVRSAMQHTIYGLTRLQIGSKKVRMKGLAKSPQQQEGGSMNLIGP